jgi:integrase
MTSLQRSRRTTARATNNNKRSTRNNGPQFASVADYCKRTRARKLNLGISLGLSRFRFYGVLFPDRYPVALTDEEIGRIAELLNQHPDYVRNLYARRAA